MLSLKLSYFNWYFSTFLELGMLSILVNDGQSVQHLCSNVGYLVSMKTPGVRAVLVPGMVMSLYSFMLVVT